MNKSAIYHAASSNYCFPENLTTVTLRLRVDKSDTFSQIVVVYGWKYDFYVTQHEQTMTLAYVDNLYAYYETSINLQKTAFTYVFRLNHNNHNYYYTEDGLLENYDFKFAFYNCFQLPYINEIDLPKPVHWWKEAVVYQIFVDRFYRGEKDKDYINMAWDEIPKNQHQFAGGDLKGIRQKLPYLVKLGINTIYLTPIFSAPSNHKYDIIDYFNIDQMFGSNKEFKLLIEAAHDQGIKVILDAVFNHVSVEHPFFKDVIENGDKSKYFDWFIINGSYVNLEEVNYEHFGVAKNMPKLNTSNEEVIAYLLSVAKHYVEVYKIDGYRLDVSDEVSHFFWRKFREELKKISNELIILGENWHNAYPFLQGDQFDSIMNYSFTKAMLDYLAFNTINSEEIVYRLNNLLVRNTNLVNKEMLNLLESHDTHRFFTEVDKNRDKLEQALAIMFMCLGIPSLYYGVEIPMNGGYDPDNRRAMEWENIDREGRYFKNLQQLIRLRKRQSVIEGTLSLDYDRDIFIITRKFKGETTSLYVNRGKKVTLNAQNVLISNNYQDGVLHSNGYVIMEENV